jgi:hypothetical protein
MYHIHLLKYRIFGILPTKNINKFLKRANKKRDHKSTMLTLHLKQLNIET